MGKLNLYRKLDENELNDCIEISTKRVASFIENEQVKERFKNLMSNESYKEAISSIRGEMEHGYEYLAGHLRAYLKAKEMMENGETIYTDLINTDTVL